MGELAGEPTMFVSLISKGLLENKLTTPKEMFKVRLEYLNRFGIVLSNFTYRIPKIHTLREDKNDRWTKGIMIDFFINSRTKDMFRFATVTGCFHPGRVYDNDTWPV
ncbi:hypothetical protein LWM68_40800 [Niabella sp. W65]|nr:hypothetical protein [Niabella sp. W65]MCH7368513.1 hypothetical protein [Niabella sp. W65]